MPDKWISVDEERPPCDGGYEITNFPEKADSNSWEDSMIHRGFAEYDGYGFKVGLFYRPVKFWRKMPSLPKRYGKVNENPSLSQDSSPGSCCIPN